MLLYSVFFVLLGFIGLYFGAKFLVIALENIAQRLGVSHLLVGLTILAIGTSLPEISVSIMGGLDKLFGIDPNVDGIVIGNKIGSFLTQITLILGILGLSQSIFVSKWVLRREGTMLFLSVFIFLLCAIDGVITRLDAIIMVVIYFLYLLIIIKSEKKLERLRSKIETSEREGIDPDCFETVESPFKTSSTKKDTGFLIIGFLILIVGAEVTIIGAHSIAKELSIPESVIGILVVGIGTSLPELISDLTAIRRKSFGIAIGDILGSNICDILLATGAGSLIINFKVDPILILFDIPMLFIAIAFAFYFLWTEKTLKKWEAAFLVSYYGFYVLLKLSFFQM